MSTIPISEIKPNENLELEGIPPIPTALAETVNSYTQFRTASFASWHPINREMLITTRFCDTAQVHQVKFPLGSRYQLTFLQERVIEAAYQPIQGDYFVFSKDLGGNEFSQNYRYDFATGEITLLTDGKSRNSLGVWSNSGTRMVYTSTRRNGKDTDLYLINPIDISSDRIVAELDGGGWVPLDWSLDDKQLIAMEYISINETYLWLIDIASGDKTLITPRETKKIAYQAALFSKHSYGLYVVTDRESEFLRLAYLDMETYEYTYLTSYIPWNIEQIQLSENGKFLAFIANENGASILHLWNIELSQEQPLPSLPMGLIFGLQWHKNNRHLGFTMTSARSTADVYSLDVITAKIERWTESETGGLDTASFAEPELVQWQSFDNLTISGFLYRPQGNFSGKRPIIIDIHGGPEEQFRPTFLGRYNFYLNKLGCALLFPNIRGSSGYGKTFLQLDNGYLREDSVKDIGALIDWIAIQPNLDNERILITGASYGGYMSLAVATHYSNLIRAAIDIVGISNFVTFLENTERYRQDLRRVEYGDEQDPKMRNFLLQISPITNAHKIQKPLFVIHGQNDPRVPINEAEQIVATVRKNEIPVWYLKAKDEGHIFTKKKNIDFQLYSTVMFVQNYLLA